MSLSLRLHALTHSSPSRGWLQWYRDRFASLAPPARGSLLGRFQGQLVGPAWFRHGAPLLLAVLGMRGWWGKEFGAEGRGVNLVRRRTGLRPSVPLVLREAPSHVDGRKGVRVEYPPGCAWHWRLIVDELRWWDDETVLAMSHVELPLLRRLTLPFVLHRMVPVG
jgi:hypothetical protein